VIALTYPARITKSPKRSLSRRSVAYRRRMGAPHSFMNSEDFFEKLHDRVIGWFWIAG
jgi:hypothetical protein